MFGGVVACLQDEYVDRTPELTRKLPLGGNSSEPITERQKMVSVNSRVGALRVAVRILEKGSRCDQAPTRHRFPGSEEFKGSVGGRKGREDVVRSRKRDRSTCWVCWSRGPEIEDKSVAMDRIGMLRRLRARRCSPTRCTARWWWGTQGK